MDKVVPIAAPGHFAQISGISRALKLPGPDGENSERKEKAGVGGLGRHFRVH
jgi:hypothetical protein